MDSETSNFDMYTFGEVPLGYGAFGTVYPASLTADDNNKEKNPYAAKFISKKLIAEKGFNQQLVREMTIHKKLVHENIVKYVDELQSETDVIIIMERCNSETLDKICTSYFKYFGENMSVRLIQHFVAQIVKAIEFMHSLGIVHRDLKLENVMLKFENEKPLEETNSSGYFYYNSEYLEKKETFEELMLTSIVKIIDLGFAKELDERGKTTTFLGTLSSIAPEILEGKRFPGRKLNSYTPKVDVWAIGGITYFFLTCSNPFPAEKSVSSYNDLYIKLKGKYSIPSNTIISRELLDFINALLQFNEDERLSSYDAMNHPFIAIDSQNQRIKLAGNFIEDGGSYLELSTISREKYLDVTLKPSIVIKPIKMPDYLTENDPKIEKIFAFLGKYTVIERQVESDFTHLTLIEKR